MWKNIKSTSYISTQREIIIKIHNDNSISRSDILSFLVEIHILISNGTNDAKLRDIKYVRFWNKQTLLDIFNYGITIYMTWIYWIRLLYSNV